MNRRVLLEDVSRSSQIVGNILDQIAAASDMPKPGTWLTRGGRAFNLTWQQALDMRNMLAASELIARSALARQESRGAHYRQDFPRSDDANWLKNIYIKRNGTAPEFSTEAVKLSRLRP